MKPEEQRTAIAEVCGWKRHGSDGISGCWDDPKRITRTTLPEYLNDLNAMHEAEKTLSDKDYTYFGQKLNEVWLRDNAGTSGILLKSASATAAQRAEAFLKTLNLWKD